MTKEKDSDKSSKGAVYQIPVKGSLGLLATGDKGLRAWRKVRDQNKNKKE
jgi:hypothetical protein